MDASACSRCADATEAATHIAPSSRRAVNGGDGGEASSCPPALWLLFRSFGFVIARYLISLFTKSGLASAKPHPFGLCGACDPCEVWCDFALDPPGAAVPANVDQRHGGALRGAGRAGRLDGIRGGLRAAAQEPAAQQGELALKKRLLSQLGTLISTQLPSCATAVTTSALIGLCVCVSRSAPAPSQKRKMETMQKFSPTAMDGFGLALGESPLRMPLQLLSSLCEGGAGCAWTRKRG